jgi:DNA repair ATPase RecN
MYVRLKEYDLELALVDADLKDVDGYRSEVQAAWSELEAAQRAVRQASAETTRVQSQYDVTTAELEQLRTNRVQEIQKRVAAPATSLS